jgi:hypothetical protein
MQVWWYCQPNSFITYGNLAENAAPCEVVCAVDCPLAVTRPAQCTWGPGQTDFSIHFICVIDLARLRQTDRRLLL